MDELGTVVYFRAWMNTRSWTVVIVIIVCVMIVLFGTPVGLGFRVQGLGFMG